MDIQITSDKTIELIGFSDMYSDCSFLLEDNISDYEKELFTNSCIDFSLSEIPFTENNGKYSGLFRLKSIASIKLYHSLELYSLIVKLLKYHFKLSITLYSEDHTKSYTINLNDSSIKSFRSYSNKDNLHCQYLNIIVESKGDIE